MGTLAADLRYAFRLLAKSWGFTFVAVTALAVGIGANTTIFGFVNGLLLRPLDVPEPDRLARVDTGGTNLLPHLLYSEYEEYRDRNQSFANLAMFHHGWVTPVRIDGESQMIAVTPVSGNYFETLGVRATKGRTITPEDDRPNAPSVVVLSHEGHRRYFAEDPDVVGRTIHLRGEPYAVVGVTSPKFKGTVYPNLPQIYSTFRPTRVLKPNPPGVLIGRLKSGVARSEAEADLSRIAAQLSQEQGARNTIAVHPASAMAPQLVRLLAPLGVLFMVIMAAVLWVTCCNIAVLLLARAAARRREIGIRIAVGANRAQLLRQLFVESLLLASIGGLGGCVYCVRDIPMVDSDLFSHSDADRARLRFRLACSRIHDGDLAGGDAVVWRWSGDPLVENGCRDLGQARGPRDGCRELSDELQPSGDASRGVYRRPGDGRTHGPERSGST